MRSKRVFITARLVLLLLSSYSSSVASFVCPSRQTFAAASASRLVMSSSSSSSSSTSSSTTTTTSTTSSLASDYAILIRQKYGYEIVWELHSLSQWDDTREALCELSAPNNDQLRMRNGSTIPAVCSLSCQWSLADLPLDQNSNIVGKSWSIDVSTMGEVDEIVPMELICILGRIMVQSAASEIAKIMTEGEMVNTLLRVTLQLLDGSRICQQIHLSNLCDNASGEEAGVRQLFASLNSQYADLELVDMVNDAGLVLGALPRSYIHTWNILHRGSGILVSKDKDVFQAVKQGAALPEVYVHQRTSSKRIFPSLYDMFVGGVSCHGEDSRLTAAREVAEELGLRRALDIMLDSKQQPQDLEEEVKDKLVNPLSEPLFQCTVCTSYNRCVVFVFTYTACDGERITWQDEEVAWGDYVPYSVVEQSAASSIDRLVESGVWPGKDFRIINDTKRSISDKQLAVNSEVASKYYCADTWDYVPDGLLVWKAWNSFLSGIVSNPSSSSSL
ncbi:hypothetical protein ACHAWU_008718 [Discostella pseudostelligera]|uniref:Nudix hydrolase domain-containing protein n=1 Tax=Discostella pseudostelligera TaxID=259834 RepID=A0ABD3M551_9STRA